jgi:murein DD-endopeptidase MepM/ murein hydrolase activator NlpD
MLIRTNIAAFAAGLMVAVVWSVCSGCGPRVLSGFGDRCGVNRDPDHPCRIRPKPHDGVDFGPASVDDPVIASADGSVLSVSFDWVSGTEVTIAHWGYRSDAYGRPYITRYLHLERARVKPGDLVRRGDIIGQVGLFVNSGGIVHVHWRLGDSRGLLDPMLKSVGCYRADGRYPTDVLQLTYPLRC